MTETDNKALRTRLLGVTALAASYCMTVENAAESEPQEFVARMIRILPSLYSEFTDIVADDSGCRNEDSDPEREEEWDMYGKVAIEEEDAGGRRYYGSYVDEDYYNSVRRHMEQLLGPDDTYLETFEEDMKYSDTPIAASVSESLADIFQPLYNFISVVKDTDGEQLEGAYRHCHEEFEAYWSQTLCNVLRALNHIYYRNRQ